MAIQHNTIQSLPDITIKGEFSSPIISASIDTRTLSRGELFVAFNGAQVDGHDFITNAISRGASAIMASTLWDGCETWDASIPLIMTKDPAKTLADLATAHRMSFNIPLIAITGTNGKTTTKNLLSHILSKKFSVLYTKGNFNNHIGLPLTLLQMNESHDIAVIEMGASQQGDIEYLCNIARPTQGLITNVSMAHTEFFHDLDTIQLTKGELFQYLSANNGQLFINEDDPRIRALAHSYSDYISFGFHKDTESSYSMTGPDQSGCYDLHFHDLDAHLRHPGKALALNAAAAVTIASHNNIEPALTQEALQDYPGEKGRMQHVILNGVHFYNDAYNANPASALAGLETMAEMGESTRKILVFADMLELGDQSQELHLSMAEHMLKAGFDYIILLGLEVMIIAKYLEHQEFKSFYHNVEKSAAIQRFLKQVMVGDLVYLKGSRSMQLEDFLTAYKESN
jgi:UDP-N-acetylmuramoyl-tripeptide--D-alanyl-D-alanine ligase